MTTQGTPQQKLLVLLHELQGRQTLYNYSHFHFLKKEIILKSSESSRRHGVSMVLTSCAASVSRILPTCLSLIAVLTSFSRQVPSYQNTTVVGITMLKTSCQCLHPEQAACREPSVVTVIRACRPARLGELLVQCGRLGGVGTEGEGERGRRWRGRDKGNITAR